MMRLLLASLALAATSACGFTPVYSNASAVQSAGAIEVTEIPERLGYELRQNLIRQLAPGLKGVPEGAVLTVEVRDQLGRLAVRPDQAASRSDLRVRANYTLAWEGGSIVGEVSGESSFNVPDGPYGDISAQTEARERAAQQIADRIVADLRIKAAQLPDS